MKKEELFMCVNEKCKFNSDENDDGCLYFQDIKDCIKLILPSPIPEKALKQYNKFREENKKI